jgi:hypothetical protein
VKATRETLTKFEVEIPKHDCERAGFSASLAIACDLWGQTVAHRIGCNAKVPKPNKKVTREVQEALWIVQRDWRAASAGQWSFPTEPRLSPWVRRMALEAAAKAGDQAQAKPEFGSLNHKGDVRAVQLAFFSMRDLLNERHLWRTRWGAGAIGVGRGVRLLTWLFVVPHLTGVPTDVASWCHLEWGDGCDPKRVAEAEAVLRAWARFSSQRLPAVP